MCDVKRKSEGIKKGSDERRNNEKSSQRIAEINKTTNTKRGGSRWELYKKDSVGLRALSEQQQRVRLGDLTSHVAHTASFHTGWTSGHELTRDNEQRLHAIISYSI